MKRSKTPKRKLRKSSNSKERVPKFDKSPSTPKFRNLTPTSGKLTSRSKSRSPRKKSPNGTKIAIFSLVNGEFEEANYLKNYDYKLFKGKTKNYFDIRSNSIYSTRAKREPKKNIVDL